VTVRPVRALQQKRGWAFNLAVPVIKPLLLATTKRTWIDGEKIPATGGCILVFNHVSHVDPLTAAHLVYDHGRMPRYLAKSGLFKNKAMASFLTAAGQIPVERLSRNAKGAFDAAVAAVRAGECVVVYPEGTLTRDPDLWPMAGKSGAARIALETGCPVIPVGQWGAHNLLYPYSKTPHLFPRTQITVKVGDPVPLDDLREKPRTGETVNEATRRIMAALTELVAELRHEQPPAERFDPRTSGVRPVGNPKKAGTSDKSDETERRSTGA
jgi:1-acyl-sn-glycerol-3-phosphate acyltransferase